MDIFLIVLAFVLMLLGLAGSFLPVLPGPITSWLGLLVLNFTKGVDLSTTFLVLTFIIALLIMVLDYIIPAMGTKRFGGSKVGVTGTTIGLIVGLIAPIPFGIIIGPFLGALVGELIYKNDMQRATKAAFGSFIGFVASTFMKFVICVIYFGYYIIKVFNYNGNWF
jgi:uncharacterized protein YqgC (DUF456 family)